MSQLNRQQFLASAIRTALTLADRAGKGTLLGFAFVTLDSELGLDTNFGAATSDSFVTIIGGLTVASTAITSSLMAGGGNDNEPIEDDEFPLESAVIMGRA